MKVSVYFSVIDFYLNRGTYKSSNGDLILNGKDFYSYDGTFGIGKGTMTLNFTNFINDFGMRVISVASTAETPYESDLNINLSGVFKNNSTLTIDRNETYYSLFIKGGDFYNGSKDHSGSIFINQGELNIEKDLISQGVSDTDRSKIQINKNGRLDIEGDLLNQGYSHISINDGNYDTSLLIRGSLTNQEYSNISINGGSLDAKADLTNDEHSSISINGGSLDVGDYAKNTDYYLISIGLSPATGNLINQEYSNITINDGNSFIRGNFTNKRYSDISINGSYLSISGNLTNENYSNIKINKSLNGKNMDFSINGINLEITSNLVNREYSDISINARNLSVGGDLTNGNHSNIEINNGGSLKVTGELANRNVGTYGLQPRVKGDLTNKEYSSISINGGNLDVKGNLTNDKNSKILINSGILSVKGNLTNKGNSNISIGDQGRLKIIGNLVNEGNIYTRPISSIDISFDNLANKAGGEMHFLATNLKGTGGFVSEPGSKLYLSGTNYSDKGTYTSIQARNINIEGALVYFSKGGALADQPYSFLIATTGTLRYDSWLVGVQDVLSDDGSVNEFYEALIEPASDNKKVLRVTFKAKEVNISNESERNIIDSFSEETPISGFDIKNLSMNQIGVLSQNINDGFRHYADSKDSALSNGFEVLKANVFARMVGGRTSNSYQSRSARLPYNVFAYYATNSQDSSQDMANILEEIAQSQKENNLYINLLGAFQSSKGGYGYGYGLSVGYDRSFDDKIFVGAYLAYIGGGSKFDMLSSQTQGFEVGVYGRFETSIIETDLILNQGYAYNKNTKNITILSNTFTTYSGYSTASSDMLLQSGPKFVLGKNSLKPYLGVNVNFYTGANVNEDTDIFASSYDFKYSLHLGGGIGIEYKRMFKNGYFFIRPSYEANVWSNASETKVVFLGNSFSIAAPPKEMFGSVLLGGEMRINDSILVNLNLSAKASNQKNFITTGLASLRYVF